MGTTELLISVIEKNRPDLPKNKNEFVELAFNHIGIKIAWSGEGVDEIGKDEATGRELVFIDPKYLRPTEVDLLLGDASKAKRLLG